jgi:hypothetical protein
MTTLESMCFCITYPDRMGHSTDGDLRVRRRERAQMGRNRLPRLWDGAALSQILVIVVGMPETTGIASASEALASGKRIGVKKPALMAGHPKMVANRGQPLVGSC